MHPNRLSIMKLLHENFSLASVDIKNELNLSWGEYTSHINALENKGFVSIHSEFQDGNIGNVVYLEEVGRREFENLIGILTNFLDGVRYDFFDQNPDETLYPATDD